MNKYFAVTCKCGHVGRNNYILITFPVIAVNKKEAARIARNIPRCKHNHKDCIKEVTEISYGDFLNLEKDNDRDPYLKCKCIQDQREIDITYRVIKEQRNDDARSKTKTNHKIYFGKTKIKYPKKFLRFHDYQTLVLDY